MKELWNPLLVDGYKKYAVSTNGRVFSFRSNKYLKPVENPSGYLTYGYRLDSMHRLVVKTFIGEIPKGYHVNHIDGDKKNNHISNLEIVTPRENMLHAYRIGLASGKGGEENSMAKLSEKDVMEMYQMFSIGKNNDEVANVFGVHSRYVSLVRHGKRWKTLYEMQGKSFPKSFKYQISKSLILLANNMILRGYTNRQVVEATGIEASMVSRIRNGHCYKDFIESYTGILATTIETTPGGGRE